MLNLKTSLLSIIDAIAPFTTGLTGSVLSIARWAISEYVPDTITVGAPTVGDAPDSVKDFINSLFDMALGHVSNVFLHRALVATQYLVVTYALDKAWDAIFPAPTPATQTTAVHMGTDEFKQALNA